MIIIGDELIGYDSFETINDINKINSTKPNSTLIFEFDKDILNHCLNNNIFSAPKISNITQSILANAMGAKYQICDKEIAKKLQKIAENYIYDSRILAIIEDENEIEELAIDGIDGVIYKSII
jgi:hypothetical protein